MKVSKKYTIAEAELATEFAEIVKNNGASGEIEQTATGYIVTVTFDYEPQPDTPANGATTNIAEGSGWERLIAAYSVFPDTPPQLKTASLSQWILESGRGTSDLARDHLNFGGLMYRDRMAGLATPVTYTGSDGLKTDYCKFTSVDAFIRGYWHFISSGPYDGWDQYSEDSAGYIRHIAGKYAADPEYSAKVQSLFAEAQKLLGGTAPTEAPTILPTGAKLAIVVGHNSVSPGAHAVLPLDVYEFAFNTKVAEGMVAEAAEFNIEAKKFHRVATSSYSKEIETAYSAVAEWKPDAIVELHFNSFNAASAGTEMLFRAGDNRAREFALKLVAETHDLLNLPLRHSDGLVAATNGDRGYKSLSAIPSIPTVLTEPFFGSNPTECAVVAVIGPVGLGRAYLRAARDWIVAEGVGQ